MNVIYKIALTLVRNVGHITAKNLLAAFGTPEAVFSACRSRLLEVEGVGKVTAEAILSSDALERAEQHYKAIRALDIAVLFYADDAYPRRLKECFDAPLILYYKGTADLNHPRIVSIVGTRMATPYGLQLCQQLAATLSAYNVMVVSGLAYGIDVAAHRESLSFGIPTVGVLGHGLDRLYPSAHRETAEKMKKAGGLLTEFPLKTAPDKENFPKRNRLIAGLADVTIVVEAALKGGALITAELANSYDRDVFAFPGRVTNPYSQGCNFLIKTHRAGLITEAKDLAYFMGWEQENRSKPVQLQAALNLSAAEQAIVSLLSHSALSINELARNAGIKQSALAIHLLNLEIRGIIVAVPGSSYQLI